MLITLTKENIWQEHICCALSKNDEQVISKKEWLMQAMDDGFVFVKGNVREKCFIEYMPLSHAYSPIVGENMMMIQCFWVAGKYQGQGYGTMLLKKCQEDCYRKNMKGMVMISSKKKKPFVMDYHFLAKHGFMSVDQWNDFELMFCPLEDNVKKPHFEILPMQEDGLVLYYTHQCPFHVRYVRLLQDYCQQNHIPLIVHHITSSSQAKQSPTPIPHYSLFYNRKFITREVLNEKKFQKIWSEIHE